MIPLLESADGPTRVSSVVTKYLGIEMVTGWVKPVVAKLTIAILTVPLPVIVAQVVRLGNRWWVMRLVGRNRPPSS